MPDKDMLLLHEVLEEEYVALYGALPAGYPTDDSPEVRLAAITKAIHGLKEKRSAFCISGGGIRSATFGLGIMQGLARCNVLSRFDYISTVSGGGYIGSWLSSWIHRVEIGEGDAATPEQKVAEALAERPASKLHPEPQPVEHLRQYSNYLAPKLSLLSADTWTLVAIYVRNLLLNWLVLLPLIAAALMLPRVYASILTNVKRHQLDDPGLMIGLLVAGIVVGALGIAYIGANRPSGTARNNPEKRFLIYCLAPLSVSALLLSIYWAWYVYQHQGQIDISIAYFIGFGVLINLTGFLFWVIFRLPALGKDPRKLWELPAVIIAGAVSGLLIYLAASSKGFLYSGSGEANLKTYVCLAIPILLLIYLLGEVLFIGLISLITSDEDREWWSREEAWLLIVAVGWAGVSALVVWGPIAMGAVQAYAASAGGVSGIITALLGRSSSTPANQKQKEQAGAMSKVKDILLKVAAGVFTVFLLVLMALAVTFIIRWIDSFHLGGWLSLSPYDNTEPVNYYRHLEVIFCSSLKLVLLVMMLLAALSLVMARFVNINRFSLHSMYRNRLIRAYLGASNTRRDANRFTNFDDKDNLRMHEMWPRSQSGRPRKKLMHVINMALNLVGGDNLAWQERKAESFTASPLHCGNHDIGYRRSAEYGGDDGISIGTAMAISGAAASPNMGYYSSTFITFLMMLFNARLGWWLGNPGPAGEDTYRLDGPMLALKPLVAELLGRTNDRSSYIYLSDGGHFENLGLYEMVLRRCHFIVVSDGSADAEGTLESLGNAVRKIRIDTGIPIEFPEKFSIYPRSQKEVEDGTYCAIGKIRYSCVDTGAPDGVLLYFKPAFYGTEPRDIFEYGKVNPAFPHETTADQFFSESQFESYRMLGSHIIELICGESYDSPDIYGVLRKSVGHCFEGEPVPTWLQNWLGEHPEPQSQKT